MDQEGQVLRSGRVPNLRAQIEKFLEGGEEAERGDPGSRRQLKI